MSLFGGWRVFFFVENDKPVSIKGLKKVFARKFPGSSAWKEFRTGAAASAVQAKKLVTKRLEVFERLGEEAKDEDQQSIYAVCQAALEDVRDAMDKLIRGEVE